MKNKTFFNTIVKITLISMVLAMSMFQFSILPANAAALTNISDTMSRLAKQTDANHSIAFTTATALTGGQKIKIQFGPDTDAFTLKGTLDSADLTVTGMTLVDTCGAGASEVTVAFDKTEPDENITFTVCTGDTVSAGAKTVDISHEEITNPDNAGTYKIAIKTLTAGDEEIDSGSLAVAIIDNDQVTIQATVEPTFTFSLTGTTMTFGSFATPSLRYANNTSGGTSEPEAGATTRATVSTNAVHGAAITIRSEGNGTNAGLYSSGASYLIAADTSYNVIHTTTNDRYGVYGTRASSDLTVDEGFDNDNINDVAISRSPQNFASSTSPVDNAYVDVIYVARTIGSTPAGSYVDKVTLIATGTF
jgi:hypothetical protein